MSSIEVKKPRFITFEGIDGSGKSTQLKMLSEYLSKNNIENVCHSEPTKQVIGKQIRAILSGSEPADPRTIALLFAADRIEHVTGKDGILDNLNRGVTVLSDRYYFSSFAYQVVDMPLEWVMEINKVARELAKPDLHIFIDVSPELSLERISANRDSSEIFENKAYLTRARENFMRIIEKTKNEENTLIINGDNDLETVAKEVIEKTKYLF